MEPDINPINAFALAFFFNNNQHWTPGKMSAFPHLLYGILLSLDRINQGSGYSVFSTTSLYFFASENNIPDVLENSSRDIPSLEISFQTTLVAFALLLIVSIFCDKFGIKLSIPGSIFLFFLGLFINIENLAFETIPLEQVHVIALCVLLFFSGLTSDRLLLKKVICCLVQCS